jgi:hypothetical protein
MPAWSFSASIPWVSRHHEHVHNHLGESELLRWDYSGVGDLEFSATRYLLPQTGSGRYFVRLGLKAPTGRTQVDEVDGSQPEPSARPGSGSWDLLAGMGAEWRPAAPGAGGGKAMPVRVSLSGRLNGRGTDDYRAGAELQAHLGAEYPIAGPVSAIAQTNLRVRGKNDAGSSDEEEANTGGTVAFISPGIRVGIDARTSVYGLFQIPVYQRVNGIQLTADSNLFVGISRGIF